MSRIFFSLGLYKYKTWVGQKILLQDLIMNYEFIMNFPYCLVLSKKFMKWQCWAEDKFLKDKEQCPHWGVDFSCEFSFSKQQWLALVPFQKPDVHRRLLSSLGEAGTVTNIIKVNVWPCYMGQSILLFRTLHFVCFKDESLSDMNPFNKADFIFHRHENSPFKQRLSSGL